MAIQSDVKKNSSQSVKSGSGKKRSLSAQQIFRRIIQTIIAVFIVIVGIRHVTIGEGGLVIAASPESFCPFGGLETLYRYITAGGKFVTHTHLSNIVVLIAAITVTFLFRSAFCGWICTLGYFQDLINIFSGFLQKRSPVLKAKIAALNKSKAFAVADRYLRLLKYAVLLWAVGGSSYFGYMVFREYDPWATLINIAEFSFTPGIIVLALLLLGSFIVKRPWCRYACPFGAISGLIGKLSPVYVKRNAETCISCKKCSNACPMGLTVHSVSTVKSVNCISCLECIDVCPVKDTLEIKAGIPLIGK